MDKLTMQPKVGQANAYGQYSLCTFTSHLPSSIFPIRYPYQKVFHFLSHTSHQPVTDDGPIASPVRSKSHHTVFILTSILPHRQRFMQNREICILCRKLSRLHWPTVATVSRLVRHSAMSARTVTGQVHHANPTVFTSLALSNLLNVGSQHISTCRVLGP